jgi:DNA-directed RNA polymerase specialized sigma24 family protein
MEGKDGFDAFYQDSYARLVRQLWAVTGSRQDAEDVAQGGLRPGRGSLGTRRCL